LHGANLTPPGRAFLLVEVPEDNTCGTPALPSRTCGVIKVSDEKAGVQYDSNVFQDGTTMDCLRAVNGPRIGFGIRWTSDAEKGRAWVENDPTRISSKSSHFAPSIGRKPYNTQRDA
jgi:hypothetical protein